MRAGTPIAQTTRPTEHTACIARCPRALGTLEQPHTPTPRTSCDRGGLPYCDHSCPTPIAQTLALSPDLNPNPHPSPHRNAGTFPSSPFTPLSTSLGVDVGLHWCDGPVVCDQDKGRGGSSQCHGYLEVYYSVTNETFFAGVSADAEHPFGELKRTQVP